MSRPKGVEAYTHTVEGKIDGVPFCHYFKRLSWAERCAQQTGGTLYDLMNPAAARRWSVELQQWVPVTLH